MIPHITGFSTALFSTWYFVDDLSLMLDCGDGAVAALMQKSRKVRTVALSHADRDHLSGLPAFLELNAREEGLPVVLHPRDGEGFPGLRDFLREFDRREPGGAGEARWEPVVPGSRHDLGKAMAWIEPLRNRHLDDDPARISSVSYRVVRAHHRLRPEFAGLDEAAIVARRRSLGDDAVMIADEEVLLAYSADLPVEAAPFWGRPRILIHEATFLRADDAVQPGQDLRHSSLDAVIPMACELPLEALILGHFSTRYPNREILGAVRRECRRCRPGFPVHVLLPGVMVRDILRRRPVWEP